jgi:murein DD-endopeptidase MepM/ murein hydrolase activator NlpD
MKFCHYAILLCAVTVISMLSFISCSLGNDTTLKSDLSMSSPAEEFNGMGGADSGLPSERPDAEQGEMEILPEVYYTVYTVKKSDIVGNIAKEHNISQDAIISLNKLRNTRTLQIGQVLKIPSINGILYTAKKGDTPGKIADKYQVSLEKIAVANNLSDNIVKAGAVIFLPDAKLDWVTLQEINGDLFRKPLRGSYYISSRYGWRNNPFVGSRTFHNGIDMATSRGNPIYAALDGTVSATGYNVTYGNYVIISHHSGYQTMYGHMTTILTSRGKYVTTTTKIGTVGNTGQSTGPHVHFTVYKNRATINPSTLWN